jgi:molybdenum cofactor cytidylyltransferase
MYKDIIGILLAAGKSTRFGSNKLLHLLPEHQTPVAAQSARNLLGVLPNSVAVVRDDDQQLKSLLSETGIRLIENPRTDLGMSSSICCGIESANQLLPNTTGWVLALADMPYIPAVIIKKVADAIIQGALIAAPEYKNQRGHPVGFSCQLLDELLTLTGDVGARSLIDKYSDQLYTFATHDEVVLRDIDRPQDLIKEDK